MGKISEKVGFVGGGAMAQAIAEGLIESGTVPASNISVSALTDRTRGWWEERGVNFSTNNLQCVENSTVVMVSVKPHLYTTVLEPFKGKSFNDRLWVSIMAGVTLKDLSAAIYPVQSQSTCRIVRTIPNTPMKGKSFNDRLWVSIMAGVTLKDLKRTTIAGSYRDIWYKRSRTITAERFRSSVSRMNPRAVEIPERLQNAFAAMAGSGPAYIYQVIEALADGGVMMGLPRDLAMEHSAAMVRGAATMVLEAAKEGKHPAKLKVLI
ncbi:pyrroline-5-carboxylate reductase [Eurytemora carolleeae]|uniref:pyrroline-5-carboxylate reductase n=1 Tax=Eurytemora carolleeae TaxID=1294199 RepID=UPI000C762AFF|nr:pyrroline-5-carboxylate reductase [Eurytemora carolleeae]|eukprot:XP_023342256.1 pyrroline-5-carboxylate reductase-like [Eurytemora affinis]